jgi:hypothetical protein
LLKSFVFFGTEFILISLISLSVTSTKWLYVKFDQSTCRIYYIHLCKNTNSKWFTSILTSSVTDLKPDLVGFLTSYSLTWAVLASDLFKKSVLSFRTWHGQQGSNRWKTLGIPTFVG